jgi:hypothetical protein
VGLVKIPPLIIQCQADQLKVSADTWPTRKDYDRKSYHRYRTFCRQYLDSRIFSKADRQGIVDLVHQSAYTMSDPADLINVAVERLNKANIELPAFSTLERLVKHERQRVHELLYQQIATPLNTQQAKTVHTAAELAFPGTIDDTR